MGVSASIRDLTVQLHRGNGHQAEPLIAHISAELTTILHSGADPLSFPMRRAQQTMFAIDEARTLLAERDLKGALEAARDAGREWKQDPSREKS